MNDDLNIVVSLVDVKSYLMINVALRIPSGLNSFSDWRYYREKNIVEKYKHFLPDYNIDVEYAIANVVEIENVIIVETHL